MRMTLNVKRERIYGYYQLNQLKIIPASHAVCSLNENLMYLFISAYFSHHSFWMASPVMKVLNPGQ